MLYNDDPEEMLKVSGWYFEGSGVLLDVNVTPFWKFLLSDS